VAAGRVVRDAVEALLRAGRRPLLLGGDCTVLLGATAALGRTHPDAGLVFVDGHLDCYDGASSETGEGADMELAVLLGVGAPPLTGLGDRVPLMADDRVVCLGPVDEREAAERGAPDPRAFAPGMTLVDGAALAAGPGQHGRDVEARMTGDGGGFWLHLDLDVLHGRALPAVDYPQDDGLDWDELGQLLEPLVRSPGLIGMDLTIYNPTLDPDGTYARRIVELLTAVCSAPA
jgi:arginase